MHILGISAYYHDAAACLIDGGKIVAAAQEERFTRKKHDASFPVHAIQFCLEKANISVDDLEAIVFYDKPFLTFERLLETYLQFAPKGFGAFLKAMPVWLREKLFLGKTLKNAFKQSFEFKKIPKILFSEHHESHAASAFYPSPFERAAVLCMDGVGEFATTSAWLGNGNQLDPLWQIDFPHSLGLLYSAFTYYTGFKVNSGEYKVMGLAPYGTPRFVDAIYRHLLDLKEDGTFRMNMDFFDYCTGLKMTSADFDSVFGGPPRKPESELTQREMDLAASVQVVTEEVVLRLAKKIHKETGADGLCLAGGVALNCVANGRLLREGPFKKIWIQPAAGDSGGAIGCALSVWHKYYGKKRVVESRDSMRGSFLGPHFENDNIEKFLIDENIPHEKLSEQDLYSHVARDLANGKVIGWFQGAMEFGPRALGGRSIIGDARSPKMQSVMNLKIKHRESFRPFAPSILRERVTDFFELDADSPYMLLVAPVAKKRQIPVTHKENLWGIDLLNVPRSDIPAVTHVDYSARVQTVTRESNPRFYDLIKSFDAETGYPVIVNTSFNVRGEPIVCTPKDAYRCFMRTEMDTLVLENFVLNKAEQPKMAENKEWLKEFELD